MKFTFSKLFVLLFVAFVFAVGCKKDDAPAFVGASKAYSLYTFSTSTGQRVQSGTATITELSDGNAKASVNFSAGYVSPGTTYTAGIYLTDTAGNPIAPYVKLNDVTGDVTETNPLKKTLDETPVKYSEVVAKTGYLIKVFNGNNVVGQGKIE